MDLQGLDTALLKKLIQIMFESIEFTIYPHSLLIDLEPFVIYSYEPRKRSERLFSVLREKVTYCDIFSARQGVLTRTE